MFEKGAQRLQAVLARYERDRAELEQALGEMNAEHNDLQQQIEQAATRQDQLRSHSRRAQAVHAALTDLVNG